jgi:O-acetyl-ADP-ribose deacetylase (regulator of RNase III)
MSIVIQKNILTVETGVICHQTNCQGAFGAGLAKAVKAKYPFVYQQYRDVCNAHSGHKSILLLGESLLIPIEDKKLYVANIFGQHTYGVMGCYTDYRAVEEAFRKLAKQIDEWGLVGEARRVFIPYKIGCALGGGNWEIYLPIVEEIFPDVTICKL